VTVIVSCSFYGVTVSVIMLIPVRLCFTLLLPLIRSRLCRFINLFSYFYLLTYITLFVFFVFAMFCKKGEFCVKINNVYNLYTGKAGNSGRSLCTVLRMTISSTAFCSVIVVSWTLMTL